MTKITRSILALLASAAIPLAAFGDEPPTLSEKLTSQAEAQYAAGKIATAYKTLHQALQADPNNWRALSSLSLVALKAGKINESLEASLRVATKSSQPALMAEARFNYALACQVSGRVDINGQTYCEKGFVHPLLEAWVSRDVRGETTQARAVDKKLDEFFRSPAAKACVVTGPNQAEHRYYFVVEAEETGPIQRIYVQHPRSDSVKRVPIRWGSQAGAESMARQVARWDLDAYSVTLMEAEEPVKYPVRIGTQICGDK